MEQPRNLPDPKDSELRRRLFQNSGLIMGCRVVTATTSLIAVPFITSKLRIEGFGIWELMTAIASLCAMFQTSVNGTLLWKISQAHGTDDYATIRRMIRIGVLSILVFLLVLGSGVWMIRYPLIHGLHIKAQYASQVAWVFPSVVCVTVLGGINDTMGSAISGCQRSGVVTVIQAIALVVNYVTAIILIRLNYAYEGLLIGLSAGTLVASVLYFRTAYKLCGGISLVPTTPTVVELKSMARYGFFLIIGSCSQALRDQTDKLVLARFASTTWVGYYGIAARLAVLVMEVSRFFYSPLLTAAGSMHAAKNWVGVQRLYANMIVLVAAAAGIVTVIVAGLHDRLMFMWLGYSRPQVALIVLILLTGNASAVILTGPGTAICRAIGKVWVETAYVVINLVGNLVLTIVLVMTIGPLGTVIASGSTWAVSAVAFTFILPRLVDLPNESTAKARWFLFVVAICSVVTYYGSQLVAKPTSRMDATIGFFILGTLAAALYLGIATAVGLIPKSIYGKVIGKVRGRLART
ncbi:MAG: polysaccharide biosynthesis C-terminal domain-containing protein [Fimbriimonas sp.]|nr:polysaccharide biosynthesis C-terminal domain-containing protein [Fimbriimonas sp.]